MSNNSEKALKMHEEWSGKLETTAKAHVNTREDLAIAYTPGVAEPCKVIAENPEAAYKYTIKANTVAVVSDGSAVLGLGNIGALAAMPVMEGKCVLFKEFGNVDAFPLCIKSKDVDEIVNTIYLISGSCGGVNLEDISAPRCFEIEKKLNEYCAKVGIEAGAFNYTFNADSTFTSQLKGRTLNGTYSFNAEEKTIELKYGKLSKLNLATMTAYVVLSDNQLSLLFNVDKLLDFLTKLSSLSDNTALQTINKLASEYDGMKLGFELSK